MRREYRLGRLRGDRFWTDGSRRARRDHAHQPRLRRRLGRLVHRRTRSATRSRSSAGGSATCERKGDRWYELPEDLDYVLSLMDPFDLRRVPAHVTTIAWVRNWTERWLEQPWFQRADVLLASSQAARRS